MDRRQFIAGIGPALLQWPSGRAAARQGAATREFTLVARPGMALADTGRPVAAWTYGGSVPGPALRVRQGERVRVRLENQLGQPTTVHWHGVRLPNAMDGVPHVTQPPVAPGQSWIYEFDAVDAGTFWYHSHFQSAEQLDRGLYGTLVVEEPEPLPVHRDLTWVLDDWRITREGRVSESFGSRHDMAHAGRIGNVITVNGSVQDRFEVRPGERIRLRLLNAANARIFALKFHGHHPRVMALDGHPVTPHEPPGGVVVLAPGMRCDLVLEADGRPGERHEVHDVFHPSERYVLMDLVYAAQPLAAGALPPLRPLAPNPLPEPDLAQASRHDLVFSGGMMGNLHEALLDGRPTDMRGLLQHDKAWAINGHVATGHAMRPLLQLERGRSCVLRMRNDTRWHHPIHLHGHAFRVLRRNDAATDHREWQDTVLLVPGGSVEVAFVADNPGRWMLHCHVLEHQDGGMMGLVQVSDPRG